MSEVYDNINPNHYKNASIETIDMMVRIWGPEIVAFHCEITAFKYRSRIGTKPGQSLQDEFGKIKWYEDKAKELRNKLDYNSHVRSSSVRSSSFIPSEQSQKNKMDDAFSSIVKKEYPRLNSKGVPYEEIEECKAIHRDEEEPIERFSNHEDPAERKSVEMFVAPKGNSIAPDPILDSKRRFKAVDRNFDGEVVHNDD